MQNVLSLWLNAGAQIIHSGHVLRPRQNIDIIRHIKAYMYIHGGVWAGGGL